MPSPHDEGMRLTASSTPSAWREAFRQALGFVFPSSCVVCEGLDGPVCQICVPVASGVRRAITPTLVCFSGADWSDKTAPIMRALKESGMTRVARELAPLLDESLRMLATNRRTQAKQASSARLPLIVPIPTRAQADRKRGYRPVEVLLKAAGVPFERHLRVSGRVRDQRQLGRDERQRNAEHAFVVRRAETITREVIIVDDVVTTGSTLAAAARALESAGVCVIAAVTVLNTPRTGGKNLSAESLHSVVTSPAKGDYGE